MILIKLRKINDYLTANDLPKITSHEVIVKSPHWIYLNLGEEAINLDYLINYYDERSELNLEDVYRKIMFYKETKTKGVYTAVINISLYDGFVNELKRLWIVKDQ